MCTGRQWVPGHHVSAGSGRAGWLVKGVSPAERGRSDAETLTSPRPAPHQTRDGTTALMASWSSAARRCERGAKPARCEPRDGFHTAHHCSVGRSSGSPPGHVWLHKRRGSRRGAGLCKVTGGLSPHRAQCGGGHNQPRTASEWNCRRLSQIRCGLPSLLSSVMVQSSLTTAVYEECAHSGGPRCFVGRARQADVRVGRSENW